jgi:hypothetical protein
MRILTLCALVALLALPGAAASTQSIYDGPGPFRCTSAIDYDLVKVTPPVGATYDAVSFGKNCSGRIGLLDVYIEKGSDGVKVQNAGAVAHDIVVESGSVVCDDLNPGAHQDAMQAMGGYRITFRNMYLSCLGNSNWFVSKGGNNATTPTDIVCDGCTLGPDSASALFIGNSVRSGASNSFICGRTRIGVQAVAPVTTANTELSPTDPRCLG